MKRTSLDEHIEKLAFIKVETEHPEQLAVGMIKGHIDLEYWDVIKHELEETGKYNFFKSVVRTYMGCHMLPEDKKRYDLLNRL